jgi:hypothetical protein
MTDFANDNDAQGRLQSDQRHLRKLKRLLRRSSKPPQRERNQAILDRMEKEQKLSHRQCSALDVSRQQQQSQ